MAFHKAVGIALPYTKTTPNSAKEEALLVKLQEAKDSKDKLAQYHPLVWLHYSKSDNILDSKAVGQHGKTPVGTLACPNTRVHYNHAYRYWTLAYMDARHAAIRAELNASVVNVYASPDWGMYHVIMPVETASRYNRACALITPAGIFRYPTGVASPLPTKWKVWFHADALTHLRKEKSETPYMFFEWDSVQECISLTYVPLLYCETCKIKYRNGLRIVDSTQTTPVVHKCGRRRL